MPRVVDRCRNGDAVVTAEYCTRALYGAIINMQRMEFSKIENQKHTLGQGLPPPTSPRRFAAERDIRLRADPADDSGFVGKVLEGASLIATDEAGI